MTSDRRAPSLARRHPVALIWLGMLTYSTAPVLVVSSMVDGATFSMMRLLLGVPIVALITITFRGERKSPFPGKARVWIVSAGAAFGGHQLCFMLAVNATSVTDVVLMNALAPVVVMLLAAPMFGERTSTTFRLWVGVAIAGSMIVTLGGATGPEGNPAGMALAGVNVMFFSLFYMCSKAARPHVDVWPLLFAVMVIATLVVGAFFVGTGRSLAIATEYDWLLATAVAAGPGAFGHFFMTWPLARLNANIAPVVRLLQPVSAGGLAWAVLGQGVTNSQLVGGVVTAAGILGVLGVLPPRPKVYVGS